MNFFTITEWLCNGLIIGAAFILISQSISFARYNANFDLPHQVNEHAVLFGIAGLGLVGVGMLAERRRKQVEELLARIQRLEMKLSEDTSKEA
jgi:hypothetical membrane protein